MRGYSKSKTPSEISVFDMKDGDKGTIVTWGGLHIYVGAKVVRDGDSLKYQDRSDEWDKWFSPNNANAAPGERDKFIIDLE